MLLNVVGAPECGMDEGSVCTADTHQHGKDCMGRLSGGLAQLLPSAQTDQQAWIKYVHSLSMPIHAWTTRNEVSPFRLVIVNVCSTRLCLCLHAGCCWHEHVACRSRVLDWLHMLTLFVHARHG
jgi:hypothetical protein